MTAIKMLCSWRLQWGRRNYPAETPAAARRTPSTPLPLQWGRRNYPAETPEHQVPNVHVQGASMGPPELPGGNICVPSVRASETVSMLQWGRRNYPAETSTLPQQWSSASGGLQWGRRNYPAETRKRRAPPDGRRSASMGPPELPGGNDLLTECAHRRAWSCFNGAAGITRRKHRQKPNIGEALNVCAKASMGPPELPGGNVGDGHAAASSQWMLQWGRRNYPAETWCEGSDRFSSARRFNGAAGITRRKLPRLLIAPICDRYRASMGPPELPGGNCHFGVR